MLASSDGLNIMKCDKCNRPATIHLTEIKHGKKLEKHLCEACAAANEGIASKGHTPINELLTNFVMAHAGLAKEQTAACEQCGITWAEFRQSGLFGCEHDYDVFEAQLTPLLQRAHEGGTHHIGKTPGQRGTGTAGAGATAEAGAGEAGTAAAAPKPARRMDVTKLRKELQRAVEAEDYERAAQLRDEIKKQEA